MTRPTTVRYRTERTCCSNDTPVIVRARGTSHYESSSGAWIECFNCGTKHYADRVSTTEKYSDGDFNE